MDKPTGYATVGMLMAIAKNFAMRYGVTNIEDITLDPSGNGIQFILTTGETITVPFDASELPFIPGSSGLTANNIQDAIYELKTLFADYVTLNTDETISGQKTFSTTPITKSVEFVNNIDNPVGNKLTIVNDNGYNSKIKMGSTENLRIMTGGTYFGATTAPITDNATDLGVSNTRWKDLYLVGKLSDGTDEVTIAQLANPSFKKIAVPSSTTLTDDEIADVIFGCQIDGDFLNLVKPTLFPAREIAGSVYRGLMMGYLTSGNAYIGMYEINKGTKVITQLAQTNNLVDLRNIANLYMGNYTVNTDQFGQLQIGNANTTSMQFDGSTVRTQNIVPMNNNQKDLGSSSLRWKDLYLAGFIDSGTSTTLKLNGVNKYYFNPGQLMPAGNNEIDLGNSSYKWKDLYLSGNLTDGTNSASILDLIGASPFKKLNLTSTTLTADQVTLLQSYNVVLESDVTLGSGITLHAQTILTKPFSYSNTLRGLYIDNSKVGTYLVDTTTNVLGQGAQDIILNGVAQINSKAIPSFPSDNKTYLLEQVNGTLSWVESNITPQSMVSDAFSTSSTYAVGNVVIYNNTLYRCTTAVTIAGDWDGTKWTATTVEELIKTNVPSAINYLTTAPVADNTDGDLKIVVLSSEPATKYNGYLYIWEN